jgi:formylglycine-generating enzyme required for sulfatase activity
VTVGDHTVNFQKKPVTAGDYLAFLKAVRQRKATLQGRMTIKGLLPISDSPLARDILARYDLGQDTRSEQPRTPIEKVETFPDEIATKPIDGITGAAAHQFANWAKARLPFENEVRAAGKTLDLDEVVLYAVKNNGVATLDFPALKQGANPQERPTFSGVTLHLVVK